MAADHVASMLLQYAHMVGEENLLLRANSKHRVWEMLPESLYGVSNGTNFYDYYPLSIEDFMSYRIVVTTLTHSAKFSSQFQTENQPRPITHLFIDEAAQSSEPSCLIPTVGLLQRGGALVLAGDPLQLGPVVISPAARARGLGISLMERLKNTCPLYNDEDPDYTVMLVNNFRSHQDILHIPNQLFYNGQLKTYAAEDAISHTDILGEKSSSCAIVFHGVRSQEQRMGKTPSYYNTVEIQTVQVYVKRLIEDHGVQQEDIGIVTPYVRQVHMIRAWLHAQQLYNLEVGTVEAFQGQERRVIIVSTVRASCSLQHEARSQLGFLVDDKRFNVAVTRAKAKLIIIGNPLCLEKDLKWVAYMQQCRQFGSYRGFDPAAAAMDTTRIELLHRVAPIIKGLKTSSVKAQAPLETEHLETMDVDEEGKAVLKIEDRNQELETGETGPPSQIMEVEN